MITDGPTSGDVGWIRLAIDEAWRAGRAVRPNPRVGCVLVRDGAAVGVGYHHRAGGPHAEVEALRAAGDRAAGATAYVTLEPCAHHGRTPPCADALIAAGVCRVVYACADPNPLAAGGAAALRAAGVEVVGGVGEALARPLLEEFLVCALLGRAHLRLKLAASFDGQTAAADGISRWITGKDARRLVHRMRREADAVMVGSGTVLADDPRLDVRDGVDAGTDAAGPPLRVVVDRRLRTAEGASARAIFRAALGPARVYCAADAAAARAADVDALGALGVDVVGLGATGDDGDEDSDHFLAAVLADLHREGQFAVLCEGGATLSAALLRAGLVDRLELMLAPKLLGNGVPLLSGLGVETLADAVALELDTVDRVGDDIHISARPRRRMRGDAAGAELVRAAATGQEQG